MSKYFILAIVSFVLASVSAKANEYVLSVEKVDQVSLQGMQFAFDNEAKIKPKDSDFNVVNAVHMSSEQGSRVAVVTIRNDASGSRILESDHIMALFADGSRRSPFSFPDAIKLDDGEQRSFTLSFGESNYPILTIYTSNNLK
ncbi:hypothetical protein NQT69_12400 [Pseudoalteromonas shioyasakiensis]|uniref:hypothetical protein n=1 Tax=Pseudoalteromonas shioyasakiensis TaxID=1190813 RepID=UPI002119257D|nr:hypothetical protein [Pseudoalteromonas shioyasakiensis]MCQ8878804.1 hypothetical protein [Pseudoalteromonas shioyasakiensis]